MGLVGRDLDLELEPQTAAQVLFALRARARSPGARVWHVYVHVHVYVRVHLTPVSTDPSRSPSRDRLLTVVRTRTRTRTRPRQASWCACPCAKLVSSECPSVQVSECPSIRAGASARAGHRDESPESHLHCGSLFVSVSVSGWHGRWAVKTSYLRVPTRKSESELYNSNLLDTQVLSPYTHTSILSTNLAHLDRGVPNGTRRDGERTGPVMAQGSNQQIQNQIQIRYSGSRGRKALCCSGRCQWPRSLRPEA